MRSKYPPQLSEINLPGNLFSYLGHFRESWIGALSSREFYRIEVLNGTRQKFSNKKFEELFVKAVSGSWQIFPYKINKIYEKLLFDVHIT